MPAPKKYNVGQGIEYNWEVRDPAIPVTEDDPDANLVNPSAGVTLTLSGAGASPPVVFTLGIDPELLNPSTGRFQLLRAGTLPGNLRWRWQSFGDYEGVDQGYSIILDSNT